MIEDFLIRGQDHQKCSGVISFQPRLCVVLYIRHKELKYYNPLELESTVNIPSAMFFYLYSPLSFRYDCLRTFLQMGCPQYIFFDCLGAFNQFSKTYRLKPDWIVISPKCTIVPCAQQKKAIFNWSSDSFNVNTIQSSIRKNQQIFSVFQFVHRNNAKLKLCWMFLARITASL